eukprot:scaffold72829_cov61-Phaeocystis_antarctica.AAC.5
MTMRRRPTASSVASYTRLTLRCAVAPTARRASTAACSPSRWFVRSQSRTASPPRRWPSSGSCSRGGRSPRRSGAGTSWSQTLTFGAGAISRARRWASSPPMPLPLPRPPPPQRSRRAETRAMSICTHTRPVQYKTGVLRLNYFQFHSSVKPSCCAVCPLSFPY